MCCTICRQPRQGLDELARAGVEGLEAHTKHWSTVLTTSGLEAAGLNQGEAFRGVSKHVASSGGGK